MVAQSLLAPVCDNFYPGLSYSCPVATSLVCVGNPIGEAIQYLYTVTIQPFIQNTRVLRVPLLRLQFGN